MKAISTLMMVFLISACSANFDVMHVKRGDLAEALKNPGVFYMLPKTHLEIATPMRIRNTRSGLWQLSAAATGGVSTTSFPDVLNYCILGSPIDSEVSKLATANESQEIFLGQPTINSVALPDEDQIYFLKADFGTFAKFSHTFSLGKLGVVNSIDSKITNPTVTAIQFGLDLGTKVLNAGGGVVAMMAGGAARASITPNCDAVKKLNRDLSSLQAKITDQREAKKDYLQGFVEMKNPVEKVSPELLGEALKVLDANIAKFESEFTSSDHFKQAYGSESNAHYSFHQIHEPDKTGVTSGTTIVSTIVYPVSTPVNDPTATSQPNVHAHPVGRVVATSDPEDISRYVVANNLVNLFLTKRGIASIPAVVSPAKKKGYRYRIPAHAEAIVELIGVEALKKNVTIAQFGHIAFLPSKIDGLSADIAPTFDPETGGLTKLVLGATPLDTEAALKAVDTVSELFEKDEKPSELDQLKDENSLLEAKKTNRALKEELGL